MATLGRWQGGAVSTLPTAGFAVPGSDLFNSGSPVRNDGSAYALNASARLTLPSSGLADGYLIIARIKFTDTSNGRSSFAGRFVQISGTGNFVNLQAGGYQRNTANDTATLMCMGFINNPSASATFDFQWESESDGWAGSTDRAILEVIPFFYSDIGMYTGSALGLLGGTTRNVVTLGATVLEGTNITRSGSIVTVTGDNKRYMVISSQWYQGRGEPSSTRTQRIFGHDYDGSADLAAQSHAYYRQASSDGTGSIIHDIIETVTASRTIEMTCYRGDGILNGEGGGDVDGQAPLQAVVGLVVIELNDEAECFRTNDGTGGQALDSASPLDLNAARTTDFIDAASWLKVGTVGMENNKGSLFDALMGANIWAASTDVASTVRGVYQGNITVDGVEDADIFESNYVRGDQAGEDTFGIAANPAGFVALADNADLGVSTTAIGEAHPIDTNAGTVGFWGVNLDTMEAAGGAQTATPNPVVLKLVVAVPTIVAPAAPTITDVDTDEVIDDKQTGVVITGTNFEAAQGTGKVEISDNATYGSGNVVEQTETAWGDTAITITVVLGGMAPGTPRYVWVTVDGGSRNPAGFVVHVHRAHAFGLAASANIAASGENTTARLTAPAGKSAGADFGGGRIQDDENPGDTVNIAGSEYREDETCIEAVADAEVDAQYQFRLLLEGTVPDTISVDPRWTISTGAQTATPSPVVLKLAVAAPTLVAGEATLTPSPVVAKFVVPAPTVVAVATLTPSAVVTKLVIPAPTLVAGEATLTPSPVVAKFAPATPTLVAGAVSLTPNAVVASFAVAVPTLVSLFTATPSPVVAQLSPITPVLVAGVATLEPSPVVATFAVAAPTLVAGAVALTPNAVVSRFVVTTPAVFVSKTLTPSPVVAKFVLAAPTLVAGEATLTPNAVVTSLAVAAPTVVVSTTLTPSAVVTKFVVAAPILKITLVPDAVIYRLAVASPSLVIGVATLAPDAVGTTLVMGVPTVLIGAVTLAPSPVTTTLLPATPTVVIGVATLTPSPVSTQFQIATPSLQIGAVTLTPSPVVASWQIVSPNLAIGEVVLANPIVLKLIVTTPLLVSGPVSVAPGAVVTKFQLAAPTVQAVNTLTPSPVSAAFVIAAATLVTGNTIAPSPVSAVWQVASPTVVTGVVTATPSPVVVQWGIGIPTVLIGPRVLSPDAVSTSILLPGATLVAGPATLAPAPVVTRLSVATPTLQAGAVSITPSAVVASFAVAASIATSLNTITPSAVVASFAVAAPVAQVGPVVLTPSAVAARFAVRAPTIILVSTLSPDAVVATWQVVAPGIQIGPRTVAPPAVVARFGIGVPTIVSGAIPLEPSPVVATFLLPSSRIFIPIGEPTRLVSITMTQAVLLDIAMTQAELGDTAAVQAVLLGIAMTQAVLLNIAITQAELDDIQGV